MLDALETGLDPGDPTRQTIHGMTRAARSVGKSPDSVALLGASLASREETYAAIERLHDEMSRAGRALAQKLGFAYPEEVEATARRAWSEFRSGR